MLNQIPFKTKALALAVALGTIPVVASGMVAYQVANHSFSQVLKGTEKVIVSDVQNKANLFMRDRFSDIQVMANLDIFADPKLRSTTTAAQKAAALNRMQQAYKIYNSIAVFDIKGNPIAQTKGKALGNHFDRSYIQAAIKANGPVLSQPAISTSSGIFSVYAASPIKDLSTGQTIGFIRARMPVKFIQEAIENNSQEKGNVYLINKSGEVFIGPQGIYANKTNSSGSNFSGDESEHQAIEAEAIFPKLDKIKLANELTTGLSPNTSLQTKDLLAYAPPTTLEGLPDLNWSAIFATDTNEVFAPQRQMLLALILGTGVTALITSGVAFVLSKRIAQYMGNTVNVIASSSNQIAVTVEQQEQIISQQASSVNKTTTTMDELGAASRQAAEQAEASAAGAQKALSFVEEGTQAVQQTMEGMTLLKKQVRAIAEQIMRLSEQTGQIAGVSELVADLANQTNMLALNAAVEAARAGEQGKGFGVVAGEIRKLADESKTSADKINNLVTDIQAAMNSTVMVTDEGTKKTDEGIKLTQGTVSTFAGVADAVNNVFLNSQQISLSAKQQAVAVQQVLSGMNAINLGSQETSMGIRQVKTSTHELDKIAKLLQAQF